MNFNYVAIITASLLLAINSAHAGRFMAGDSNRCYVDTVGTNHFWYCGTQETKCAGKKLRKYHYRDWLVHGESFSIYDPDSTDVINRAIAELAKKNYTTFWCCGGTNDKTGRFVQANSWSTTELKTINVEGGTCTYEQIINACGEEISTPCTEATNCAKGYVKRNDECVVPCEADMAYESEKSSKCIECKITQKQGIDNAGVCVKCDNDSLWDNKIKQCIPKKTMTATSTTVLQQCWRCPNNEVMKKCATVLSSSSPKTHSDYNSIVADCMLQEQ